MNPARRSRNQRSADFQSAVSPISNRQTVRTVERARSAPTRRPEALRYSPDASGEICAMGTGKFAQAAKTFTDSISAALAQSHVFTSKVKLVPPGESGFICVKLRFLSSSPQANRRIEDRWLLLPGSSQQLPVIPGLPPPLASNLDLRRCRARLRAVRVAQTISAPTHPLTRFPTFLQPKQRQPPPINRNQDAPVIRSLDLNPHRMLAAVGERGDELPDAGGEAGGFRVEVRVPCAFL